jgi:glycosyltransferase involved in cell wall biosynthesis
MSEFKLPTICLNMIVKNESHIIEDSLNKLCNKIKFDYWVIVDTGSTDNTREIIENFFKSRNIPGELKYEEWQNFGYNRTVALNHAYNKTDLLLIFDADDELVGELPLPSKITHDRYMVTFGKSNTYNRC